MNKQCLGGLLADLTRKLARTAFVFCLIVVVAERASCDSLYSFDSATQSIVVLDDTFTMSAVVSVTFPSGEVPSRCQGLVQFASGSLFGLFRIPPDSAQTNRVYEVDLVTGIATLAADPTSFVEGFNSFNGEIVWTQGPTPGNSTQVFTMAPSLGAVPVLICQGTGFDADMIYSTAGSSLRLVDNFSGDPGAAVNVRSLTLGSPCQTSPTGSSTGPILSPTTLATGEVLAFTAAQGGVRDLIVIDPESGGSLQVIATVADTVSGLVEVVTSPFVRGDCNQDGGVDIGDPVALLNVLFAGAPASACEDACDHNDDGGIDVGDGVYLLSTLFSGGPNPPDPHGACGFDPTPDSLGCVSFLPCP